MIVPCIIDGVEEKVSGKGNLFANVFVRGVDEDGNADFKQAKYATFDEDVIVALRAKHAGECVNLDLEIRDATVRGIGV